MIPALAAALMAMGSGALQAQDEAPRFKVGAILDTRYVHTDDTRSWLDGGLGKLRYGTLNGGQAELFRLSQAALQLDGALSEVFDVHVQVKVDAEPDNTLKRGKFGLVEAYALWKPDLSPAVRARVRAGLFFPPLSLEHPLAGWTIAYTITPSAVNAWIGEEVRATGAEASLVFKVKDNDITATGAVFGMNDPSASLLAWRGWAMHDRITQTADELPFAALPIFRPGALFGISAPWSSPVREVDGRLGVYGAASWRWPSVLEARGLHYDSRSDPLAFDGRQYAWKTRFDQVALRLELPGPVEALGQHLWGTSGMGTEPAGGMMVDIKYQATYGLLTAKAGRHRFTARYDRFEVEDRDLHRLDDPNQEEGHAWTGAYLLETGQHHRLAVEWLRIVSDRPARALIGLPTRAEEDQLQASFRVLF
jgi:hypothetical protein